MTVDVGDGLDRADLTKLEEKRLASADQSVQLAPIESKRAD
jgi:hypothetical protein